MRNGIWIIASGAILLCLGGIAEAQFVDANSLCLNGGSGYRMDWPCWGYPNHGGGKYFPSYAHIPSTPWEHMGVDTYPWKTVGWGWTGMMIANGGDEWYWETCLQHSLDNPYASSMSFDYPLLYFTGAVSHSGAPQPIYWAQIPSAVPDVGGYLWLMPSSSGGWNAYLNIFATLAASWIIPSTNPNTAYDFSIMWNASSVLTVPSSCSIWEFVYSMKGDSGQYLVYSCEGDCNKTWWAGNKGRNYSIICDIDNNLLWYWGNGCSGTGAELDMGLFLLDSITIPVNVPGAYWGTPYVSYGFDVGTTCLTPYLSSNNLKLKFMTMDYTGPSDRIVVAAFGLWPAIGPIGKKKYRLPHGWDVLTSLFVSISSTFFHQLQPGYPSSMYGTTFGAHTATVPFPYDPVLQGAEIKYSSWPLTKGSAPSAGFMATYF